MDVEMHVLPAPMSQSRHSAFTISLRVRMTSQFTNIVRDFCSCLLIVKQSERAARSWRNTKRQKFCVSWRRIFQGSERLPMSLREIPVRNPTMPYNGRAKPFSENGGNGRACRSGLGYGAFCAPKSERRANTKLSAKASILAKATWRNSMIPTLSPTSAPFFSGLSWTRHVEAIVRALRDALHDRR